MGVDRSGARKADPQRAVERLAEDEALRGGLTDAGFGPLLAWAANLAVARAGQFGSTDELYLALRRLVAGVVEAAETGDLAPLRRAATTALLPAQGSAALRAKPPKLGADPDANARAIVERLAATGMRESTGER